MNFGRRGFVRLIMLGLLGLAWATPPATGQGFKCFPSCDPRDGRFLVVAFGPDLKTLTDSEINLEISVAAGTSVVQIGVFDGDDGGVDSALTPHWDLEPDDPITGLPLGQIPFEYTLYADPQGNGSGTVPVELQPGFPSISSLTMPDNDWIDYTISPTAQAQSPSGNYFYRLNIRLVSPVPGINVYNAFKIRTTGVVSVDLSAQPFSYIASLGTEAEAKIIYPNFQGFAFPPYDLSGSTYDGTFRFFFSLAQPQKEVTVWDGDFDHGNSDGSDPDTDDPDTPNCDPQVVTDPPCLPFHTSTDAVAEGVSVGLGPSTGNPPDDQSEDNPFFLRQPAIFYSLVFPDGQTFLNPNPSGNQEWEQFKVSTDPFDRSQMDYHSDSVPQGTYEVLIEGVDMSNLNALRLPARVLCVSEAGDPCIPLLPLLVGDTVFFDANGNGVQDAGENGIAGVTLEILGTLGTVFGTTTTDANGHYSFPVDPGTYTVRVAASNFNAGGPLDGTIATTNQSFTNTVVDNNVLTYDFGYRGTGSIGDRVWLDTNANGVQDTGETGINGVTVQLLNSSAQVIATTTTSGDGNYTFSHLTAGTYMVVIDDSTLPAGLVESYDLDGIATEDAATVQLAAGANRTDVDFGYRGTASLGDRVWYDLNGNGVQDSGEAGLNGVTVRLLDSGSHVIATTTTSGNGNYLFDKLPAGTYNVTVDTTTLPAGTVETFDLDGTGTANTATVTLAAGANRTDVDFGYRGTASVGDRVWYDVNNNGAQDSGEAGINGVTVQLLDVTNTVIATTTTSGNGNYTFGNLLAGMYSVQVMASTLPAGLAPSFDLDGTGTPNVAAVTLAGGANRTDVDFGYRGTTSLGDRVWYDTNGNGVQDSGETGINGVTVQLLDSGGNVIATKTTSGDGNYLFTDLVAGNYTVRIVASSLPAGLVETYDLDGTGSQHTAAVTLAAGTSRNDVDFGYRGTASIGDRVWSDTNGNGVQDSGETGINGVTVDLLDNHGNVIATTTTSGDGNYTFRNLLAGTYTVRVNSSTLPSGVTPTYDLDGTGSANTAAVTLTGGQTRTDVDFGYRPAASGSIGDRVWSDRNANGVQDSGEPGINGVTVQLYDSSNNLLATTVTSGDGNYTFTGLAAGTYKVKIVSSTLPAGSSPTFDKDGTSTPNAATVTLTAGQNRTDVDFGYCVPTCTAGYFQDQFTTNSFSNNDGTLSWSGSWIEYDTAGTGVSSGNVTVGTPYAGYLILRDYPDTGTQPSAARQANLSGFASATLSFDFHTKYVETDDAVVIEVSKDGGATYTVLETLTGISGSIISSRSYNITPYISSNTRIRFRVSNGYGGSDDLFKVDQVRIDGACTPQTQTGSIGDRVWKDSDSDGVQDSSETGINGVSVQLLNSSGTVLATQTTSGNGNYLFSGLAAGTYKVKVVSTTLPSGATPTYDLDGTSTAHTASVTLTTGQNRTDVDFGYHLPTCTAGYFQDQFTTNSFSNNDGTLSWSGSWIEYDTAGTGVSSGNVTVGTPYSGYLILRDYPDTGTQPSAARQANLSGFASATLSFDFHTKNVETDDAAVIEISKDGGATYTVLQTLTGFTGSNISSRSFNISSYISSNTRIRFRISNGYGGSDDLFKVDQVRIDAACQ